MLLFSHNLQAQKFDYQKDYNTILEQSKKKDSPFFYNSLLKRFQLNDTTLTDKEVLAFMIGFTGQANYLPYEYIDIERQIYQLNDEKKFEAALIVCDTFLLTHPASQQAFIEKAYAFHKVGKEDSAKQYMRKFDRIMEAMASTGDGLTAETAVFAVSPIDGQNFITKFLSYDIGSMGSGSDKNGNFVDILEAIIKKKDGKEDKVKLYFQIQHASQTMLNMFNLEDKTTKRRKKNKKKNE